jgi:hypothetical protein
MRVGAFRAQGLYSKEIIDFLKKSELSEVKDDVEELPPCPELRCGSVTMRACQKRALDALDRAGRWGVTVLLTGDWQDRHRDQGHWACKPAHGSGRPHP